MKKINNTNPQELDGLIENIGDTTVKPTEEFIDNVSKTADDVSKSMGFKDTKTLMETVVPNITNEKQRSKNTSDILNFSTNAKIAGDFLNALTMLILKQEIVNLDNFDYMSKAVNHFYGGELDNGNAKQLVRNLETGISTWNPNQFVPDTVTNGALEQKTFMMLDPTTGNLAAGSYRFKKMITIQRSVYLPYFISGELSTFIARLTAQLQRVYSMFIFDKIMTEICTKSNYAKVVTPSQNSTDMFKCFINDIFPAIADMETATSGYNISNPTKSNAISASTKDDRIMIMSKANKARYSAGILSQLFNASFADIDNIINYENIINPGNKLVIGDTANIITVDDATSYIDDNTIIVITKEGFKHLKQISVELTQEWAHNMTIEHVIHIWGTMGFVKWGMGFVYTNPNLSIQPTDPALPIPTAKAKNK